MADSGRTVFGGGNSDVFAEVPVQNWMPYVYTPDTDPIEIGTIGLEVTPDAVLVDPDNGWITGPDIAIDPDTGRLTVTTAGLYLVQIDTTETTYFTDEATPAAASGVNGCNILVLGINSPTGWGTNITNTYEAQTLNGEIRAAHTLYLPAGTALNILLYTAATLVAAPSPPVSARFTHLSVALTRFAPAT